MTTAQTAEQTYPYHPGTECTRGWAARCAAGKRDQCTCRCGGFNHGRAVHGTGLYQRRQEAWVAKHPQLALDVFLISEEGRPTKWEGHPKEVLYEGIAFGESHNVVIQPGWRPLPPRNDLVNHSPTGFGWGYAGSGPRQLALAICADFLGDDTEARRIYQQVTWWLIEPLSEKDGFAFDRRQVGTAVRRAQEGLGH